MAQNGEQPGDIVRAALDVPAIRAALLTHALACLGRRLANRAVADRMEKAEVACQETYERALREKHEYDPTRPVRPWLHGIMNNVLSEIIRSVHGDPVQVPPNSPIWEQLVVDPNRDELVIRIGQMDVRVHLAKLSPEHREILNLRFYDDLCHADIAARLGTSRGNARVRLCRALNALEKIVKGGI